MLTEEQKLRLQIRLALSEAINNFIKPQPETKTRQLKNNSKSEVIGDPISDVKMNQNANELGSDGNNAPTVSVTAGGIQNGNEFTIGQKKPNFSDKTKQVK